MTITWDRCVLQCVLIITNIKTLLLDILPARRVCMWYPKSSVLPFQMIVFFCVVDLVKPFFIVSNKRVW